MSRQTIKAFKRCREQKADLDGEINFTNYSYKARTKQSNKILETDISGFTEGSSTGD